MKGKPHNCDECRNFLIKKSDDHRFCCTPCRRKWHKKNNGHTLPAFISDKINSKQMAGYPDPVVYAPPPPSPYIPQSNKKIGYAIAGALASGFILKDKAAAVVGGIIGYWLGDSQDKKENPIIEAKNKEIEFKLSLNKMVAKVNIKTLEPSKEVIKPKALDRGYASIMANDIPLNSGLSYKLDGKWKYFLSYLPYGFSAIIYGLPKAGKSHLAIQFAQYLQSKFGDVAYISAEERTEQPFRDKLQRYKSDFRVIHDVTQYDGIANMIKDHKPKFVFVDSLTRLGLDVEAIRRFKNEFPNVVFIYVVQSTKAGSFRGSLEIEHEMTATIRVVQGVASQKGRTVSAPTDLMVFE